MSFTSKGVIPEDDNGEPVLALWDDATSTAIPVHIKSKVTGADGNSYAVLDVNASLTGDNLRVNSQSGDFQAGSLADGAITTLGTEADTAATSDTGTFTLMAFVKRLMQKLPVIGPQAKAASMSVTFATDNPKAGVTAASGDFADGSINTLGAQADASAVADNSTATYMSLFKRLLAKFPTIGTQTIANSSAVNIASDQTVPIKRSTVAVYFLASTTTSGATQNSGDLTVGPYTEVSIDINTTAQAGTSPTIQYFYERKGADGIYYVLWQSAVLTVATNTLSTSVGAGMAYNQSLGVTGRIRWVIGGSATPTFTHTISIQGK